MKYLLLSLLFLSRIASGAVGDLIGLEVETNGWVMRATISGLNTNGMFYNGFATNNSLSSTTALTLTVTSPGFTDTGASNAVARLVYGTRILRAAYPMQNTNDIHPQGDDCVVRIALSEFVHTNDTLTASARSGYYAVTNGIGTNASSFTDQTVTNSSTQVYQKVIAKWSRPPWNRWTNSTATLGVVAFHNSAQQGRSVRVVRFVISDTNSPVNSVTQWVTHASIDRTQGDAVPVIEYVASLSISTMSNGSPIRCDFTAYPWHGDSGALIDTWTETRTGECAPAPQTNLCDRLNVFNSFAIVADYGTSSGVVFTNHLDTGSPPAAFNTISNALAALRQTNGIVYGLSRSNLSSSIVYFVEGEHFTSAQSDFTEFTASQSWLRLVPYPTNINVVTLVTNLGTSRKFGALLKIEGLTLWMTNATAGFQNYHAIWMDDCDWNRGSGQQLVSCTNMYFTRCDLYSLKTGLTPNSVVGALLGTPLIRGCRVWTNSQAMADYCVIGNAWMTTNGTVANVVMPTLAGVQSRDGGIVAFNKFTSSCNLFPMVSRASGSMVAGTSNFVYGLATVQNTIEAAGAINQSALLISADNITNEVANCLRWNNTVVGQRINEHYNDLGVNPALKHHWQSLNQVADDNNIKTDTFPTASAARTGNWSGVWGVSDAGNFYGNVNGIGTTSFTRSGDGGLAGLASLESASALPLDYQKFANRLAYDGTTAGLGGGDYRLTSSSPLFLNLSTKWVLPFDLEGLPRSAIDPPGAYSSGNVRKGAFF